MSTFDEDLRDLLLSDATTARTCNRRIYAARVPEKTPSPYVYFIRSAENDDTTLDEAAGSAGIRHYNVDVECYAMTQRETQAVADAIRGAVQHYRGTINSRRIQGIFVDSANADYIPKGQGSDTGLMVETLRLEVVV